jgi:hypothetical protein
MGGAATVLSEVLDDRVKGSRGHDALAAGGFDTAVSDSSNYEIVVPRQSVIVNDLGGAWIAVFGRVIDLMWSITPPNVVVHTGIRRRRYLHLGRRNCLHFGRHRTPRRWHN